MKIAINCSICQPKGGGITEYIVNLTRNLERIDHENEYVLYVLQDLYEFCKTKLPERFRMKKIPYNNTQKDIIKRSLFSQRFWYKEEEQENFDVFHSPFFYVPKFHHAKVLITVHDLRLYRYPQTYGLLRLIYLQHSVKESIRRASKIISISQFTKNEIVDTCRVSPEKITVIHEAINRESFSSSRIAGYELPQEYNFLRESRFLFSLGHIEPRKNYMRLVEAFKLIKQDKRNCDLKLVIAGKPILNAEKTIRMIEETADAYYLNFVPFEMLLWLYKNASLFVFPSYYEGFGFPPLEAASLGTVSAVSKVSSMPEVCGDTAFYFDPYDVKGIKEAISVGLYDVDAFSKNKLLLESQLNKFSWERNARETLHVYCSLVSHL
jgi:glycosyltransferase involved in cell wall biosynthesis